MKPISVHVDEEDYRRLKTLAGKQGRPVAMLVREAMHAYLVREEPDAAALDDFPPHPSGRMLKDWERSDLYDEMSDRMFEVREEP